MNNRRSNNCQVAERHHRLGDYAIAKTHYELHLAEHPDDDEVHHALGVLLAQCQQYHEAKTAIAQAIFHNQNQATYHNSLGNVFRQLQDPEAAAKSYKRAIKIKPDYAAAHNNLGNVYFQQKKMISAKQCYEKAIALKNNYADAHCNLGILCAELSDDENAFRHLTQALTLNPNLLTAQNQLGDYYLRNNQFTQACALFEKLITIQPSNVELHHRLGIAYFKLQEFEKAKQQFEIVLTLDYKHPEVNQYVANTLLQCRDHEKAMHYYFHQLERNPYFETYYNLGVLLMMKERLRESLLYFEKAIALDPNDAATELNRGNIYLKQNNITAAIHCYEHANVLKPNDAEIQHILSALKQETIAEKAPDDFIAHLFDQYAPYYDQHLSEQLSYAAPQKIMDAIELEDPHFTDEKHHIIDLGCGTGLCGVLLKPFASKLIGIDLSADMLKLAHEKNCYDNLLQADITTALSEHSNVDLIVAADVFTYLGNLESTFENAYNALRKNGLFVFTVEKTTQTPFILQQSIRYAHSKSYLDSLICAHHFETVRFDNIQLRKQKKEWIEGYLVLLRKC